MPCTEKDEKTEKYGTCENVQKSRKKSIFVPKKSKKLQEDSLAGSIFFVLCLRIAFSESKLSFNFNKIL